jgi:hypothetical protein
VPEKYQEEERMPEMNEGEREGKQGKEKDKMRRTRKRGDETVIVPVITQAREHSTRSEACPKDPPAGTWVKEASSRRGLDLRTSHRHF